MPFGPPGRLATTTWLPSGMTRVRHCFLMSTRSTEPSGSAIGPSEKPRPWQATAKVEASKIGDEPLMSVQSPPRPSLDDDRAPRSHLSTPPLRESCRIFSLYFYFGRRRP